MKLKEFLLIIGYIQTDEGFLRKYFGDFEERVVVGKILTEIKVYDYNSQLIAKTTVWNKDMLITDILECFGFVISFGESIITLERNFNAVEDEHGDCRFFAYNLGISNEEISIYNDGRLHYSCEIAGVRTGLSVNIGTINFRSWKRELEKKVP